MACAIAKLTYSGTSTSTAACPAAAPPPPPAPRPSPLGPAPPSATATPPPCPAAARPLGGMAGVGRRPRAALAVGCRWCVPCGVGRAAWAGSEVVGVLVCSYCALWPRGVAVEATGSDGAAASLTCYALTAYCAWIAGTALSSRQTQSHLTAKKLRRRMRSTEHGWCEPEASVKPGHGDGHCYATARCIAHCTGICKVLRSPPGDEQSHASPVSLPCSTLRSCPACYNHPLFVSRSNLALHTTVRGGGRPFAKQQHAFAPRSTPPACLLD